MLYRETDGDWLKYRFFFFVYFWLGFRRRERNNVGVFLLDFGCFFRLFVVINFAYYLILAIRIRFIKSY